MRVQPARSLTLSRGRLGSGTHRCQAGRSRTVGQSWASDGHAQAVLYGFQLTMLLGLQSPQPRHLCGIGLLQASGRYWARTSDPQLVELVLSQLS